MAVMPWQPLHNQASCIDGEVSIDPSAVVASGVALIANPESRIVIGAGVCIGMGVVLHADRGTLKVEDGAILGAGVLMVGAGTIGARACVGPVSTVFNCSVDSEQVVAPGSLLGDQGRSGMEADVAEKTVESVATVEPVEESPKELEPQTQDSQVETYNPPSNPSATQSSIHAAQAAIARNLIANPPPTRTKPDPETPNSEEPVANEPTQATEPQEAQGSDALNPSVYGHQHLQRLMATLFPHRQALNGEIQDSPVSEDSD